MDEDLQAKVARRVSRAFDVPLSVLGADDVEHLEGCPDCGQDTVVEDEDGTHCTSCGWRV